MHSMMDTTYFVQHIQCTREGKQDCLFTVKQLVELAFEARDKGLLAMDKMIQDEARFPDVFLRKAVSLVMEISNPENIRRVLYNYIYTSNFSANQKFLNGVIITETMLAISQSEDLDYVFTYLVPSFFGFEYEKAVIEVYTKHKKLMLDQLAGESDDDKGAQH